MSGAYRKLPGRRRGFLKGASVWPGPDQILAAPASPVLTAMKWNRPLSLVRRNRRRFVAAGRFRELR